MSPGERYGYIYEINYLRCIHCDLCVEACPTQAITESKMFEFSFTNRADAIYTKAELLVDDQGFPQRLPWEDWREGEAAMTGGWMRATSPNGDAAYEGVVQWTGDLGVGVRAAEAGQSSNRDDDATGSKQLRNMFPKHFESEDVPLEQRGLQGMMNNARAKMPKRRAAQGQVVIGAATSVQGTVVFVTAALLILIGAVGVISVRNPVHAALCLIMTLFGVAVAFVAQSADFLAAVQIIVYAGAIVVLFLFVIMFLGVDRREHVQFEPLVGQRAFAGVGVAITVAGLITLMARSHWVTGAVLGLVETLERFGQREGTGHGRLHDVPVRLRGDVGAARHRGGRCRAARPPRAGGHERGGNAVIAATATNAPAAWYLVLAALLFGIGAFGVLTRRSALIMFMCIELMLNAVNLTFVTFSRTLSDISGQAIVFFVMVVAAAEVTVGLGIVVSVFRRRASTSVDELSEMKG